MNKIVFLIATVMASHPKINLECDRDTDCVEGWEFCKINEPSVFDSDEVSGSCIHKSPFDMYLKEYVGTWATLVVMFYTNCGGLGGGGAMIPICMMFFNFDARNSIALSNATIVIAGLIRLLINWNKNHPLKYDS